MQFKPLWAGYFFTFTAACCWGLTGTLARVPLGNGVSPLEVAFWRAATGAVLFIAHALFTGRWRVNAKDGMVLGSFGLLGVALFFAAYQVAIQRTGAAMAAILLYTAPFWVALFSRLLFKERLTPLKITALLIAMAGVSLVSLSGGGTPDKADAGGVLAGLLAGLFYSLHYVYGNIYLKKFSAITIYCYCLTAGSLMLLPFIDFAQKSTADWAALLGLGVLTTYAAYNAYCAALKRLAPTKVAVLSNVEPLVATLLAFIFWDELFTAMGWLGAIMVLSAVFMIMADKRG